MVLNLSHLPSSFKEVFVVFIQKIYSSKFSLKSDVDLQCCLVKWKNWDLFCHCCFYKFIYILCENDIISCSQVSFWRTTLLNYDFLSLESEYLVRKKLITMHIILPSVNKATSIKKLPGHFFFFFICFLERIC